MKTLDAPHYILVMPYGTQSSEHFQAGGYREKLAYGLRRPDSTAAETVNPGLGGGRLVHNINLPALRSKANRRRRYKLAR